MIPLYGYGKYSVVGVARFFVFVKVAGGGRHTVVMSAVVLQNAKPTKRPRKDTVGQRKEKKHIVKLRTAAEWG